LTLPKLPADRSWNRPALDQEIFGVYATRRFFTVGIIVLASTFFFFSIFPGVDLAISRLFYGAGTCGDIRQCGGFPANTNAAFKLLRNGFYALPYLILVGALIYKITIFLKSKFPVWQDVQVAAVLLATLLVGPGLLINAILKSHIGRVRPRDITAFGGHFPFVPVGQIEGMCQLNCSFVSGEAGLAPVVILSVLLFPKALQKPALVVLLPASLAMALLRVVMGAHFISDVILGYGLTMTVFSGLALLCVRAYKSGSAIEQ
jgi:lipid A 4'-phosphatase